MKEQITLPRKEAEEILEEFLAEIGLLEAEGNGDLTDDLQRHADMLTNKLAGRIE